MTEQQRLSLQAIVGDLLRAIEDNRDEEREELSLVLEDAWREYAPKEKVYLATYLREHRGYFQERGTVKHMLEYLRDLPINRLADGIALKVEAALSRAWKRGAIDVRMEPSMPLLRNVPGHVRALIALARRGYLKKALEAEALRMLGYSRDPAVVRLAARIAAIVHKEVSA